MDEQAQGAEVLKLFDQITSSEDRLAIVRLLSDRLAYSERLELRDHVNCRNDFLSSLPVELIAHIFNYLSLFEVWRLRLICRRWDEALSSDYVQRAALTRWQALDPEALVLLPTTKPMRARIRQIQATRLGRPFYSTTFEDTLSPPFSQWKYEKIALSSTHFAYIRDTAPHETKEVILRDLTSASRDVLRGDAKEQMLCLQLTNTHLSFIGFVGILYIVDVANPQSRCSHRLPSARVHTTSAHGSRVAVSWMDSDYNAQSDDGADRSFDIAIFDTAKCLSSTTVPPSPHVASELLYDRVRLNRLCALHLEARTLDVFGLDRDYVVHYRLHLDVDGSITGQVARQYLLTSLDAFKNTSSLRMHEVLPIDQQGAFHLGSSFFHQKITDSLGGLLLFDSGRNEIFAKTFVVPKDFALNHAYPSFAIWNDAVFAHHPFREIVTYRLRDKRYQVARLHHDGSHLLCQQSMTHIEADLDMVSSTQTPYSYNLTPQTCSFLVNETFLALASYKRANGSITVRSFDESVRPPGASITGCWDQRATTSSLYLETHKFARPVKLPYTEGMEEIMHSAEGLVRRKREDIATDAFGRRASYMID